MRQTCKIVLRPNFAFPHLTGIALLTTTLLTSCSMRQGSDASLSLVERYKSVCLSAEVALGEHRIPAFEEASARAISGVLADSRLSQNCTSASLQLHYSMAFEVEPFSWAAKMLATDVTGKVVWHGTFLGKNNQRAALQYLIESTASKLVKDFLTSP